MFRHGRPVFFPEVILENFTHGRIDPPMDQRMPNPGHPAVPGHDVGPDVNPPEAERPVGGA